MGKYRKKPVVVEAIQWTGNCLADAKSLFWHWISSPTLNHRGSILINTKEGTMEARKGDWIIRGIKGELYPCKPDIFAETYEKVEEQQ